MHVSALRINTCCFSERETEPPDGSTHKAQKFISIHAASWRDSEHNLQPGLDLHGNPRHPHNHTFCVKNLVPQTPGILLVNKQVSEEARGVLYETPLHLYATHPWYCKSMWDVMSPQLICSLRFIDLSIKSHSYRVDSDSMLLELAATIVRWWTQETNDLLRTKTKL